MPGMLIARMSQASGTLQYARLTDMYRDPSDGLEWWPDFSDPANRGAALEVVRERWGCPLAQVSPLLPDGLQFVFYPNDDDNPLKPREVMGPRLGSVIEAEAACLVAALEAVP